MRMNEEKAQETHIDRETCSLEHREIPKNHKIGNYNIHNQKIR